MTQAEPILFSDSSRGVYIPKHFATTVLRTAVTGVANAHWQVLARGPSAPWYWEAWQAVLDNAVITDPDSGVRYFLHHDGDLWLLPEGYTGELIEAAA